MNGVLTSTSRYVIVPNNDICHCSEQAVANWHSFLRDSVRIYNQKLRYLVSNLPLTLIELSLQSFLHASAGPGAYDSVTRFFMTYCDIARES